MLEDLENPYRHDLLVASLELLPEEITEILTEYLPEVIKNIMDVVGTTLVRAWGGKIDHIFKPTPRKRKSKEPIIKQTFVMKDGTKVHLI